MLILISHLWAPLGSICVQISLVFKNYPCVNLRQCQIWFYYRKGHTSESMIVIMIMHTIMQYWFATLYWNKMSMWGLISMNWKHLGTLEKFIWTNVTNPPGVSSNTQLKPTWPKPKTVQMALFSKFIKLWSNCQTQKRFSRHIIHSRSITQYKNKNNW